LSYRGIIFIPRLVKIGQTIESLNLDAQTQRMMIKKRTFSSFRKQSTLKLCLNVLFTVVPTKNTNRYKIYSRLLAACAATTVVKAVLCLLSETKFVSCVSGCLLLQIQFMARARLPVVRVAVYGRCAGVCCQRCSFGRCAGVCCQRCSLWQVCRCLLSEVQFMAGVLVSVVRGAVYGRCAGVCCQRCRLWQVCRCLLSEVPFMAGVLVSVVRGAVYGRCAGVCCQRCSLWQVCSCLLSEMQFMAGVQLSVVRDAFMAGVKLSVVRDAVYSRCEIVCCQRCSLTALLFYCLLLLLQGCTTKPRFLA
jgi:hypothetical protein